MLLLAGSGCGSRTGVDSLRAPIEPRADATADAGSRGDGGAPHDAGHDVKDAPTEVEASSRPPHDAGIDGACPSAVLLHSPLPMLGACSTRDGRARVAGPLHPHITWTNPDPGDANQLLNASFVAADNTGGAYLAGNTEVDETLTAVFARVDGTTGQVGWVTSMPPSVVASISPFLLDGGVLQDLAYAMTGSSVESFDPATGTLTSTPLPATLSGAGIPAIGSDGSLYVPNVSSAEVVMKSGSISRVLPDGTVAWTSQNLANFTASFGGFFTLALAPGDVSIVAEADTSGVASFVVALSAESGAILWNTSIAGQIVGGVAVAPDGSSAVIASNGQQSYLSILETTGAIRATFPVDADGIQAIGLNGDFLIGGSVIDSTGVTKWTAADGVGELLTPTIDANGTVYVLVQRFHGTDGFRFPCAGRHVPSWA